MIDFLPNCLNVASLRDARSEFILSPHFGSSRKSTGLSLSVIEIQPLRGCKKSVLY